MDTVIMKISEVESAASAIMGNANTLKNAFAEEMDTKNAAFDQRLEIQTEKQLQDMRTKMEIEVAEKLELLRETARSIEVTLEQKYQEFHTAYVEQLFQELTKE